MSTVEQAQAVERAMTHWVGVEPLVRARNVLAHAGRGPDGAWKLANAMQRMPFWNQGPSNYLDMVHALEAAGVQL